MAVWDPSIWKPGGSFSPDGQRSMVKGNMSGNRYSMANVDGTPRSQTADHGGRKRWTVVSDGQAFAFRRASICRNDQELVSAAAGSTAAI